MLSFLLSFSLFPAGLVLIWPNLEFLAGVGENGELKRGFE